MLAHGQHVITARARDAAGNLSEASPLLVVTIDTAAPALSSIQFGFDLAPMAVSMQFSEPVDPTLSLADVVLRDVTAGATVDSANLALVFGDATIWLRFPGFPRGILPDADYRLTILAAGVTDAAGNPLASDGVLDFFFLNGDANRDRRVNLDDFNILATNFGQSSRTFSQGDFTYDGVVNLDDFNVLASRFGQVLSAATSWRGVADRLTRDDAVV